MSEAARPPFDALDAGKAEAYLRARDTTLINPFAGPPDDDLVFKISLSGARFFMAERFGAVRRDGQTFRAYPFIVGRPSANAFAAEDQGLQLCGLDVGLGTAAFEIGTFVFAQATLFREIGDADGEASPHLPPGSQLAFWTADRLRERGTADGPPVGTELLPKDVQRQHAAQVLTQLMLRFVWLHEMYHGLNGHTGLLASRRSGQILYEMPDDGAFGLVELESKADAAAHERQRHAMEYDADRSALWLLVRMQQIDVELIAGAAVWPRPLRLKLTIFAAVMMTFVFDQSARRRARQTGATHPRAQHRLVDLVRTLASHLVESSGEVKQAFLAVLAEMKALQVCLPEFISAAQLLDDIHSPELQRELDEVDDALIAARVSFTPFAYRSVGQWRK